MSTQDRIPQGRKGYDYKNQAWLNNNKYMGCVHPGCEAVKLLADNHFIDLEPSGRWKWAEHIDLVFSELYGPPNLGGPSICFGMANQGVEVDPEILSEWVH